MLNGSFIIVVIIFKVWYNADGFLDKNRDTLRPDVVDLLISSRIQVSWEESIYQFIRYQLAVPITHHIPSLSLSLSLLVPDDFKNVPRHEKSARFGQDGQQRRRSIRHNETENGNCGG